MWKFYYFPQWKYEKAEKWLSEMEKNGYRLEATRFFWFFKFKKSSCKSVQYIFVYNFLKQSNMISQEIYIRSQLNGDPIKDHGLFAPKVYRITNTNFDLSKIKEFRSKYLKSVFVNKIILYGLFGLLGLAGIIIDVISTSFNPEVIFLYIISVMLFPMCYYCFGLFKSLMKNLTKR